MAFDSEKPEIELSNIQEFSLNNTIQDWLTSSEEGDLLAALKRHWKQYIPFVYASQHDSAKEDRLAEKLLFRPLEVFICRDDPQEVFEKLKQLDQPSQICGHVFKSGEPTYSCRECANDPTCVLCIQCFQKSLHKKHRYRMCTSGGGGYCDCGDPEAWKTEPFCDNHKKVSDSDEQQNPIEALPDDLVNRASALFTAALSYAVELLTWEQPDSLPPDLQPDGELEDEYICMLFNDEVHTYEQVILCLQRAINCSQSEAANYATTVDREGRSSVKFGQFSDCEKVRTIIEKNTSRQSGKPLKTVVMHTTVVGHQNFALKLIQWLQTITSKADGLRRLFCVLSMKPHDGESSLMEDMLLADTELWKGARNHCHQLMMSGVLMDQECKKQFAILFTKAKK